MNTKLSALVNTMYALSRERLRMDITSIWLITSYKFLDGIQIINQNNNNNNNNNIYIVNK